MKHTHTHANSFKFLLLYSFLLRLSFIFCVNYFFVTIKCKCGTLPEAGSSNNLQLGGLGRGNALATTCCSLCGEEAEPRDGRELPPSGTSDSMPLVARSPPQTKRLPPTASSSPRCGGETQANDEFVTAAFPKSSRTCFAAPLFI